MKMIPYSHQTIDSQDIKEVAKVLRSGWITQGPKIKEFEAALCKYTGAKYAVAVSSGTAALHISCLAAGIEKNDEVITSPITFAASANSIIYCGARPVFADVEPDTANIDPREIRKKITKRTKAIIPVHFAGNPCDLKEINKIAKKNKLIVIEDAAHALGAKYRSSGKWVKVGSGRHSDMTIFSFHPLKSITTGEGGAILTNNKDFYRKLLLLRNHGITKEKNMFKAKNKKTIGSWYYEMQDLGFNYRITDFQCALGISQLKRIDKFISKRRGIVKIYNKELSKIDNIELPVQKRDVKSAWHLYQIRLKTKTNTNAKRKKVFDYLRKKGIGVQVHYIPVYLQPFYQKLGYKKGLCPKAEIFYQRTISLPLYPRLKSPEIKKIVSAIKDITGRLIQEK